MITMTHQEQMRIVRNYFRQRPHYYTDGLGRLCGRAGGREGQARQGAALLQTGDGPADGPGAAATSSWPRA